MVDVNNLQLVTFLAFMFISSSLSLSWLLLIITLIILVPSRFLRFPFAFEFLPLLVFTVVVGDTVLVFGHWRVIISRAWALFRLTLRFLFLPATV